MSVGLGLAFVVLDRKNGWEDGASEIARERDMVVL